MTPGLGGTPAKNGGGAEGKLEALERFVRDYTLASARSRHYAELARKITDLLSDDMTPEEKSASWLLIQYAKRREREATDKETANA